METLQRQDTGIARIGEIARIAAIPSPYAYSPTHTVYRSEDGVLVFIVETAHKTYDVFSLPLGSILLPAEVS
jgi:hypothetical protein